MTEFMFYLSVLYLIGYLSSLSYIVWELNKGVCLEDVEDIRNILIRIIIILAIVIIFSIMLVLYWPRYVYNHVKKGKNVKKIR